MFYINSHTSLPGMRDIIVQWFKSELSRAKDNERMSNLKRDKVYYARQIIYLNDSIEFWKGVEFTPSIETELRERTGGH